MKALLVKVISFVSKVFPRLGARIAWYLWTHPHGRPNSRYPDGAEEFDLAVMGHQLSGFTLGSGEPVLLLHGWGGASTDMAPIAAALADAGYMAISPDLPGHGSDKGSAADAFRMAATVDATVSRFGLPRAVVAHSFGAVVAFSAFPHGGPERVVLVAPAVAGKRFLAAFKAELNLGNRSFDRFEQRVIAYAGPHLVEVFNGNGDVPGAEILVLHDPADDRTPFADAADYVESRPASTLVEVPDSGHKGILRNAVTRTKTLAFVGS